MLLAIVPTGTDAPCYHIPFGTFGMMLLNIVVFAVQLAAPEFMGQFILHFGSFNPLTWLTSACMHGGFGHIIGNMIVFVICGWIIEGKIGWWRFIALYFLIAFISGGMVQTIMLFFGGTGALGASGVIYGMIAIVMIWAPENTVTFLVVGLVFFYPICFTFEAALMVVCFFLIALEFLAAAFSGFEISSAVLHLFGVVPGAFIGFFMVKWRWVDCEGYDLISIQSGKRGKRVLTVQEEQEQKKIRKEENVAAKEALGTSEGMVDSYIAKGHFEMAFNRYQVHHRRDKRFVLSEKQFVAIINGLWPIEDKRAKAASIIELYLKQYQALRVQMTLKLARYYLLEKQLPKKCGTLIKSVSGENLTDKQTQFAKQLVLRARQMISDGVIEFTDD